MPFARPTTRGGRVLVEPVTPVLWELHEEVRYIGEKDEFIVPAGYRTDFATIPRIAVWLIPRFGSYTKAAILHDWLITEYLDRGSSRVTSNDVDNLFRRALRELRVPPWRRTLMWTGVRWGALFNRRRRDGWWKTAPAVLLWSVLFLCTILPPLAMIVVAAALVAHGIVETIATALFKPKEEVTSGSLST